MRASKEEECEELNAELRAIEQSGYNSEVENQLNKASDRQHEISDRQHEASERQHSAGNSLERLKEKWAQERASTHHLMATILSPTTRPETEEADRQHDRAPTSSSDVKNNKTEILGFGCGELRTPRGTHQVCY